MDRKKLIYIGSVLLIAVITSITYFSYAFFTNKQEFHGKLNIVVGTLDYKVKSNDLVNNSITIPAGEKRIIEVSIESLNKIASKYELYYQTNNTGITISYSDTSIDPSSGTINEYGNKTVKIIIRNKTSSSATLTFGLASGFTNKTITLASNQYSIPSHASLCSVAVGTVVKSASYTGSADTFTTSCDGDYKVELWGAQGGNSVCNAKTCDSGGVGGKGAYTRGTINLASSTSLYIYVGQKGTNAKSKSNSAAAYNGGGDGTWDGKDDEASGGGGGATDIRLVSGTWDSFDSLKSRIMVAAAGAGTAWKARGADGGGLSGIVYESNATIPSQTSGYAFGRGQNASTVSNTKGDGSDGVAGAGSGYYGGYSSYTFTSGSIWEAASSGSSFISGHPGCNAISSSSTSSSISHTGQPNHYSGYVFTNTKMIDGAGYNWTTSRGSQEQMPNPSGGYYSTGAGHTGNGTARITYLGE